jgi:glucosamine-phosphate N-acetyltransferase
MTDNLIIRELESSDYSNYLILMKEFHGYNYNISYDSFCEQLKFLTNNNLCNICIVYLKDINTIIGAGSVYKLIKLHNNPICQIEDVIITEKYRGFGYAKILVDKLCDIGLNKFKCYKVILNCLEKNIQFYEKCQFVMTGYEMKLNK